MRAVCARLIFAALALGMAVPASAQEEPPAHSPAREQWSRIGKKVVEIFSKPLHPVVESVAPGGGFGPGISYKSRGRSGGPWAVGGKAVITPRKYWLTQASAIYQGERLHVEAYGRARDMTRLDYYGIGADANGRDRASYRYTDRSAGALASVRFSSFDVLAVGGRLEQLWPSIGAGQNRDVPSLRDAVVHAEVPGLTVQPSFTSTTALLNLNYPGGNALGRHGIDLHTAYSRYHDHDEGLFDFGRFDLESQQRVRGILADHTLTFHQWFSSTGAEDVVPFYLQHTLGGAGSVRRFSEEILGSDGTKATLRGFRDLRFRGPHLLLLQAEYRVKIFGPIDMTLFVDSGMAAARRGQIGVGGLNTDGGFSLSLMTSDATALRIDVGTGGGEGTRVFFSVGPIFQR